MDVDAKWSRFRLRDGGKRTSFLKRLIPIKAQASVSLDKPTFVEGEPVMGKVNVDSNEYIQSTGVRVEARAYEHYQELEWVLENDKRVPRMASKTSTLFSRDVSISGPSDFGQGPTRSFPFSVGIPPFRPSHSDGSIEYQLKGVVAVKGRPDITATAQIAFNPPVTYTVIAPPPMPPAGYGSSASYMPTGNPPPVYQSPQAPGYGQPSPTYIQYGQTQQPQQQVRCKYCQYMMDQAAATCPNCGAHQ
ncbi:MAG TPA: hypothetical protein VFV92_09880 [Candidatus Bathyarchaeia archaeon]|nr:hypothetical protein [Candidatus Bathyarchaeia archaeon]